jgi:hypothetical protein
LRRGTFSIGQDPLQRHRPGTAGSAALENHSILLIHCVACDKLWD